MKIHSLILARPPVSSLDGCELRKSDYGVDARLAELVAERRNRIRRAQNHEGKPIPTKGIDTNERSQEILLHLDRDGAVLSSGAWAQVTVNYPANGAVVASQFSLSAYDSTCSGQPVSAMGFSLDSSSNNTFVLQHLHLFLGDRLRRARTHCTLRLGVIRAPPATPTWPSL